MLGSSVLGMLLKAKSDDVDAVVERIRKDVKSLKTLADGSLTDEEQAQIRRWFFAFGDKADPTSVYDFVYRLKTQPRSVKSFVSRCLRSECSVIRAFACRAAARLLSTGRCPFSKAAVVSAAKSVLKKLPGVYIETSMLNLLYRLAPDEYRTAARALLRRAVAEAHANAPLVLIEFGKFYDLLPYAVDLILKNLDRRSPGYRESLLCNIISLVVRAGCELPRSTARKLVVKTLDCMKANVFACRTVVLYLWSLLDVWRKNRNLIKSISEDVLRYPSNAVRPANNILLAILKARLKHDVYGNCSISLPELISSCLNNEYCKDSDVRLWTLTALIRLAAHVVDIRQCAKLISQLPNRGAAESYQFVYLDLPAERFVDLLNLLRPKRRAIVLRSVAGFWSTVDKGLVHKLTPDVDPMEVEQVVRFI